MILGRKSSIKNLHSTLKRETIKGVFLLNRRKVAIDNNGMFTDFGRITVGYDGMSMVFSGTKHMMELPAIYLRTNIAYLIHKRNRPPIGRFWSKHGVIRVS